MKYAQNSSDRCKPTGTSRLPFCQVYRDIRRTLFKLNNLKWFFFFGLTHSLSSPYLLISRLVDQTKPQHYSKLCVTLLPPFWKEPMQNVAYPLENQKIEYIASPIAVYEQKPRIFTVELLPSIILYTFLKILIFLKIKTVSSEAMLTLPPPVQWLCQQCSMV